MRYTDIEGKVEVWSRSIQPHDVWFIKGGFRFEVFFNRYYQPIRKGGVVLVKFVADIAKKAELCPIGVVNWRNVNKQVQADIVELIRKYADNGREARAMLSHLHTNGSTSFANSRDEFEMEHGREPGGYEFFDRTHKTKDGVYPEITNTQELNDMVKSKIVASVASSSSSKPRIEKPIGYGFGVKRSDVIGVHALLRKKGIASEMNNDNNDLKVKFARHKKETANLIMRLSSS
ncbi:Ubiquitin-conjugating enzyme E2 L5, partial [Bienertia sinuspersici]